MNLHLPQSLQSMNELKNLTAVSSMIITPRENKPITSIVQDIALGVYRITKDTVQLSEKQIMNILSRNTRFDGELEKPAVQKKDYGTWSGKQMLSTIIPPNINIQTGNKSYDPDSSPDGDKKNFVVVKNGKIEQGIFDKTVYQSQSKGLVHTVFNENGQEETKNLFDNTQRMICDWLVYSGFSVGISDLIIEKDTTKELQNIIKEMKVKVYDKLREVHTGSFENNSIHSNRDFFENEVIKILNEATNKAGKIGLREIKDETNRMINMVKSGSKGNNINVAQMIAALGQQNVEGKRISYGFDNRTLPHFSKFDDGPESRGFVENSFVKGLTPQEFFFHAMGGREGLIDTAVKTSETGYIQRKLVKGMEDAKINFDNTVRNASGTIIQFLYGEDGIDSVKLETFPIPYIGMDMEKLKENYLITLEDNFDKVMKDNVKDKFLAEKDWDKIMMEHFNKIIEEREYIITGIHKGKMEKNVRLPVAFNKIITNTKSLFVGNELIPSDLSPLDILDTLEDLEKELFINDNNRGNHLLMMIMNAYLSPKQIIFKHKFGKDAFEYIVQQIKFKYFEAIADPSEMVGVVAAQSIGEPATQLTLNTFHLSGTASASQSTQGVPRIKELLSVSKNIKSPSMTIYIKDDFNKDFNKSKEILNSIETSYIKDIVLKSQIFYEQEKFNTDIVEDKLFMDIYKEFSDINECEKNEESPWVLRFEFDKEKMLDMDITMLDVNQTIMNQCDSIVNCMFSDDNADNLVMRFKLKSCNEDDKKKSELPIDDSITELKALEQTILETISLKGISTVKRVVMNKVDKQLYNKETKEFEKQFEWIMNTDGSNLLEVLVNENINSEKTISNNIIEIYNIFGIEAARQALVNELGGVFEFAGTFINYRHTALLIDTMTSRGSLLSIDRHGINRSDIGPLAKSSFEETTDMIIKAGLFSEYDKVNGIAANTMLGQIPHGGTGDFDLIVDEEKLFRHLETIEEEKEEEIEMIEDADIVCIPENLDFGFDIPSKNENINIVQEEEINII